VLKIQGRTYKHLISQVNLIDDDHMDILELVLFTFNIKSEVCDVLEFLLFYFFKYEKKSHHVVFDVKH
jgi:hypothetical protein